MSTCMDRPSHTITEDGNKITIHDLELFVGHIDGFDDDDSEIKELDTEAIDGIIEKTKRHMSAGSNPKLVLMHQDENGNAPTQAIGDIVTVYAKPINIHCEDGEDYEGAGICGDVEMSREDFKKYLASNRFPRRSAEIWEDGHLSEVALLGRETPARPLRDTKFTRQGAKKVFYRPATFQAVAPGAANTYIPDSGSDELEKEEYTMPDILEHEEKELLRKLRAENGSLNDELTKLKAQLEDLQPDEEKMEMQEDEELDEAMEFDCPMDGEEEYQEDEEDEELKSEFSKLRKTKGGSKILARYAKVKRQRNIYKKRIDKLNFSVKKVKYNRLLDQLASQGYGIKAHRDHMLDELMNCKDVAGKIKFWKQTMRKAPLQKTLNTRNTRQRTKVNFSTDQKKVATEATVKLISSDENLTSSDFQKIYQQELRKL